MDAGRTPLRTTDSPLEANRTWWTNHAGEYLAQHGPTLGDSDFIWGPEGLREAEIELIAPPQELPDHHILEVGAGAAQCSRYLASLGADVVATDLAPGMVTAARELNSRTGVEFPVIEADALTLPFPDGEFDTVFTSFGVIPFVPDLSELHREIARVLSDGGRWIYSALHPARWMFPDDPTAAGMTVRNSYFDATPYQERDGGRLAYVEFHHTFSAHINALTDAGFIVDEVIEPTWPAGRDVVWGGWGPERSPYIPGTLIIASHLPDVVARG
ncbi:SAM-dependent methyltransferase [Arcanobacterium wilhelmae]|uniref:SAM-dependent methyltransferase n=1 Tax=Arcanobacterium wilhelmae TaxID=1803177 RepID=A0ABT9N999_9ACTO|nr:class I SAM-dependent methyltransferase [Arcanobacterium wilhelmae]MDP9799981.1 SAM-dependent methyltransferase [Arcanobacterium wilhelmae]WFN89482.1 class I SAM-dependent methyltransferase [Arcanobacterium wilhelmae]